MEYGSRLVRQRPRMMPSEVNPARMIPDWEHTDELDVVGFVDSAQTEESVDVGREEAIS